MSEGIDQVRKVIQSVVAVVNGVEVIRSVDVAALPKQIIDADQAELQACVEDLQKLDLSDDQLEAKIKAIAGTMPEPVAFLLRLAKAFVIKK